MKSYHENAAVIERPMRRAGRLSGYRLDEAAGLLAEGGNVVQVARALGVRACDVARLAHPRHAALADRRRRMRCDADEVAL